MLKSATRIGKKFQAPIPTSLNGGLAFAASLMKLQLTNKEERKPDPPLVVPPTDPAAFAVPCGSGLRVTWFGHSSLLFEMDGVTLLVDPVWDERASPVQWGGPRRFFAPTLPLEALPHLDAVLISHDHYDHLGKGTVERLARLRPDLRWIVPLEVGRLLTKFGVSLECITELDWTEETMVRSRAGDEVMVTSIPTRHFSGRSLWNRNETLWMGFILRGSRHRVYHGVDTGLWPGLAELAERYGPFDLTLLEIGAFHPLWHQIHLGPDGAVEAFHTLGGGTLMPIHWGLFDLAFHAWNQPMARVTELAEEQRILLFSPAPGVPTEFVRGQDVRSDWWCRRQPTLPGDALPKL